MKIVHLLENYTGSNLVFECHLVDELTKLNDLSHFFQKSKNIEPEMWSVIKLDQTITKIRKDFRKSYRYLLNKRSSFKYKVIDNKSKKLKEYFFDLSLNSVPGIREISFKTLDIRNLFNIN